MSEYRQWLRRRNRMIVAAAKEGHCYKELAETWKLSNAMISVICTRAGIRRQKPWGPEPREAKRAARLGKPHNGWVIVRNRE